MMLAALTYQRWIAVLKDELCRKTYRDIAALGILVLVLALSVNVGDRFYLDATLQVYF